MTVAALKPLPVTASLERYQGQATALLRAFADNDPAADRCIRQHHPRLPGRPNTNDRNSITEEQLRAIGLTCSDAQMVMARWHGFAGWAELVDHTSVLKKPGSLVLAFERAVQAIITGNLRRLDALLQKHPALIRMRSTREHRATLLHYVGANGVESYRQITPRNAVKILDLLLRAGAEVDADLDYGKDGRKLYPERTGSTTLGMVATSIHPAVRGVQLALLQNLLDAGANIDGLPGGWNPLLAALHNGRGAAAEFLARRGAKLDLEGAAGTGRLYAVKSFFRKDSSLKANATAEQMEKGFIWACEYGRTRVVAYLLSRGVNAASQPYGETGLHWAAYGGHAAIAKRLIKEGVPVELEDKRFGSTPLRWALYGWCYPPPEMRPRNYYEVISLLVQAGSNLNSLQNLDPAQRRKIRKDPRMRKILGPKEGSPG